MRMTRRFGLHILCAVAMSAAVTLTAQSQTTRVADAASRGDLAAVQALIKQGADVSAAQGDGMTALHWAAERGDAVLAEVLVAAHANVAAGTRIGRYTPLHLASRAGSAAIVRALLKAGADPAARTENGGVTPLHLAAEAGSVDAITALLDKGADVNIRETEWEQTPLIFAASANRVDAINLLVRRGADVKAKTKAVNLQAQGALDRQATALQRSYLAATVQKGQTPTPAQLQAAIGAVRELYATGKAPEIPKPVPGSTAAEAAANPGAGGAGGGRGGGGAGGGRGGGGAGGGGGRGAGGGAANLNDDPTAQSAIDQLNTNGPAPQIAAKGGLTALHHAIRQGYAASVAALIAAGSDVNQITGDGHSPLLVALINGQFDAAMQLIKAGADVNIPSMSHGVTPLWATINAKWQPRTRFPQPEEMELQKATYLDVMTALLEKGADVNARIRVHPWYMTYTDCGNANCGLTNSAGATSFWRAAYGADVDAMRLLVKYGADPNIPTINAGGAGRGGGGGAAGGRAGGAGAGGAAGAAGAVGGGPRAALAGGAAVPADQAAGRGGRGGGGGGGDQSGLPVVPAGGPGTYPVDAASGSEYGEGFAGNAHRHAPDGFMAAVKYLVEELGADVNAPDARGYTPLHNAAARGDNEMILYLVSKGANVKAVSRKGETTADMANGPVSRISPFPETIALLEKLGSKNNHKCASCAP